MGYKNHFYPELRFVQFLSQVTARITCEKFFFGYWNAMEHSAWNGLLRRWIGGIAAVKFTRSLREAFFMTLQKATVHYNSFLTSEKN